MAGLEENVSYQHKFNLTCQHITAQLNNVEEILLQVWSISSCSEDLDQIKEENAVSLFVVGFTLEEIDPRNFIRIHETIFNKKFFGFVVAYVDIITKMKKNQLDCKQLVVI